MKSEWKGMRSEWKGMRRIEQKEDERASSELQVLRVSFLERYNKSPSDSSLTRSKELGNENAVVTRNDGKREEKVFGERRESLGGEEKSMRGEEDRRK